MNSTALPISRRRLLTGALGLGLAAGLSGCGGGSTSVNRVAAQPFTRKLPIPPLAPSRVIDGVRVFSLKAGAGRTRILPDLDSPTWGYDGASLGPTLRAERGEQVAVEVTNGLDVSTSVHWHGMHLPPTMDGGPHQAIPAGGRWRPSWRIDQPAATLWYHPHPHGVTEEHVYRGLAGLFLIDDDASGRAALPHTYGVDDIPLIVQDKQLDRDGALRLRRDGGEPGILGDIVTTNGIAGAYLPVGTERVRLRVLNGSTARSYQFGFDDRDVQLIATDGGLLDAPLTVDQLRLAPGERAELLVIMEPGSTARLRSFEVDLGGVAVPFAMGGNDAFDVLELRAAASLKPSPAPDWPRSAQAAEDELHDSAATRTRTFELDERKINGRTMDLSRIDEVVTVGSTEVWELRSTVPMPHSFHVHDVQFRVLTIDDAPPPEWLRGPKDTIYLEPSRRYRLLLHFADYADPAMPYMYHCHMLLHEDEGMMGQFAVVEPGDEGAARAPEHQGSGGAEDHDHHRHGGN
ncbi:multicopper oxidase family protein [Microlunatus sp. GCM10028923]|uniref:multicopper oxidase family protein n=1 Tax=Microlunatus sp. GCM10028923 TaxID=3273400 RepID=UPI00361FAB41